MDIYDHKLEFSYRFGATDTVNSREVDPVEAIRDLTGDGVDMALDSFGAPDVVAGAVKSLRRGGTAISVGLAPVGATAPIDVVDMIRSQKTLVGSYYGSASPHETFRKACRLLPERQNRPGQYDHPNVLLGAGQRGVRRHRRRRGRRRRYRLLARLQSDRGSARHSNAVLPWEWNGKRPACWWHLS